jgi:2-octaprenyl-6-methoxyphenol hydroxylase
MMELQTDILVIGGGLVGGPLACLLAEAGFSVVVVDGEDPARAVAPSFDGRASAVALGAQRVLAGAGLWPAITPFAAPIKQIRVSEGASPMFLHYDHREVGDEPFGWIVENRAIRGAIGARFAALPGLTALAPVRVVGLERSAGAASATLSDGRRVTARLAVAADGRGSPTRADAGIAVTRWGYGQTAIVCTVRHSLPHHDTAQEHFLPAGPFAILPLTGGAPGGRSSVVWMEKTALVAPILAQDDSGFHRELAVRFGPYLGDIAIEGDRFAFPVVLQFAHLYRARRLALIGDAAHAMHPVAGQGMNMGLRDVAALAEVVVDARRLGLDPGSDAGLARYGRWRRFDNLLMMGLTDGLVRLFSNDVAPLRLARNLGLAAVQRMPAVKRAFMRHAMGLVGEIPRLMRGEPL